MPASLSDENHKIDVAIFDSYSKTVMRNLSCKAKAAIGWRKENETGGEEVMRYIVETYGQEDQYPSEYVISDEYGHNCVVTTEWLYQAMFDLSEEQKEVLILEFWYGLLIKDIAKLLNVTERTIYNRKQKAFEFIREYYERKQK